MGPGAPEKLGAPILLQTLALYSYIMTSENAKVEKMEKEYFYVTIVDQRVYWRLLLHGGLNESMVPCASGSADTDVLRRCDLNDL